MPTPPDGLARPIGLPLVLPRRAGLVARRVYSAWADFTRRGAHIWRILNGAASSNR